MKMRASTCDVASRTSFDSSGDEDGRESVLWDQADGAAHRAAHCGNRGVGYLGVEGHMLERTIRVAVEKPNKLLTERDFLKVSAGQFNQLYKQH